MTATSRCVTTSRRGFTLVELLVVIGIIALLISILLPALAKARKSANTIACASNMRQIGTAMLMYANDSQGQLPYGMIDVGPAPNSNGNAITWDDLLNVYVGRHDTQTNLENQWMPIAIAVFQCPEDLFDRKTYAGATYQTRSYAMVQCSSSYSGTVYGTATRNFYYTTGWPLNPNFRCFKLSEMLQSGETLLLVELPMISATTSINRLGSSAGALVDRPSAQTGAGQIKPVHNNQWNYLFVDGHVAQMAPEDTLHAPATALDTTGLPNYMWTRTAAD